MVDIETIEQLARRRGFFWPTAEIYNPKAGFWTYGPLGTRLKNKLLDFWRQYFVKCEGMIELDGTQIMPEEVFRSSGHLVSFQDPIVECKKCKSIFRADKLIEEKIKKITPEAMKKEEFNRLVVENKITCPSCKGELSKTTMHNLMLKTFLGPKQDEIAYLRPETCQNLFIDFPKIYKVTRSKLPVALVQIGKSFRNEISPRQNLFRMREFTQGEIEVFFDPSTENEFARFDEVKDYKLRLALLNKEENVIEISCEEAFRKKIMKSKIEVYYLALLMRFFEKLGFDRSIIRFREVGPDEKPFYAKSAWDFEIKTSLGWTEIVANHYRADHDLGSHSKGSGKDLSVMDGEKKVLPWVWEDSMGIDRIVYALLDTNYSEKEIKGEKRVVLKLLPLIAPYTIGVFPLVNKDGLDKKAKEVYDKIKTCFDAFYDDKGSIGKMYARQDEAGTPFCITIDYDTMKDDTVTVRNRDTTKQERVKIEDLIKAISKFL